MNLNYLRYFYVCAQNGTITKAAAKLGISQPSLSMQIKSFEEQLDFRLFLRSGRSLQLTPKGQALFLYAAKIFEVADEMERFLKKNKSVESRSLKIGVSDEVERPFIAEIVGRLIRANSSKNLMPSIISKKHEEMIKLVASEEVDLVITNQKTSELKLINTLNIPVMLVSGNILVQPNSKQLNIQNIFNSIDQKLILPTDEMILAKETVSFLKQKNVSVTIALTSNIIACISRAVEEKLGASFLPIVYVQKELKNGSLQAFGPRDGFWQHHLYLYTYKSNTNSFVASLSKILQDVSALKFDSQIYLGAS